MEWGASRILALRKHAGMTQAQFAQWLGVSTKQVKYLEHQRRNPSGPTRRLLDILAAEFHFNGSETVLVLGADFRNLKPPSRASRPQPAVVVPPVESTDRSAKSPEITFSPAAHEDARVTTTPSTSDDDAFVWR